MRVIQELLLSAKEQMKTSRKFSSVPELLLSLLIVRWKFHPLHTALKIADKEFFPNLHAILSSILTLPVGSVCCERSFSSLRRLKTCKRSTMGQ